LIFLVTSMLTFFLLDRQYVTKILSSREKQTEEENNSFQPSSGKIYAPILMYHHIALKKPQDSYYVSPEIFEKQMQWLKDNNYNIISFDDLYSALMGQKNLPEKPVVITFDDGVIDQYENALPILQKFNYTATFFIKLNNVWPDKGGMTWQMLRKLVEAKMTIGSHSMNHNNMANMGSSQMEYELTQSKEILENQLKIKVKYFSYPGGAYSDSTIAAIKKAGYLAAVTTKHEVFHQIKTRDDLYKISRIHIDDEIPSFENWVQGINLK